MLPCCLREGEVEGEGEVWSITRKRKLGSCNKHSVLEMKEYSELMSTLEKTCYNSGGSGNLVSIYDLT